jgi:hypothetical protein
LLSRIISSNSSVLTSMGSAIAGSGVLQAPHFPVSARCFAGIRFGFPQDGQFRIVAMANSLIKSPLPQYLAAEAVTPTEPQSLAENKQKGPSR